MDKMSKPRVIVLGAGFGGLELSTLLSEAFGDGVDVTLIDKSDAFVFGYSKLDVMFGRTTLDAVRLPYRNFVKPGVRLLRETVTAIDPVGAPRHHRRRRLRGRFPDRRRSAPTTTSTPRRGWPRSTNSIPSPAPSACATCCPHSSGARR